MAPFLYPEKQSRKSSSETNCLTNDKNILDSVPVQAGKQSITEKQADSTLTSQPSNIATRAYSFNEYVMIGASKISKPPYAQKDDEFSSDANGCFLSAFITNRLIAAGDLSEQFSKFEDLITLIIINQEGLTAEKLLAERQLLDNISKEYTNNGNVPDNIFILITAYSALLAQNSTKEALRSATEMMVSRVCEYEVPEGGWEEMLIATALWFSNRDGYQEAVIKKYKELDN